jgi:hypothetical protein
VVPSFSPALHHWNLGGVDNETGGSRNGAKR